MRESANHYKSLIYNGDSRHPADNLRGIFVLCASYLLGRDSCLHHKAVLLLLHLRDLSILPSNRCYCHPLKSLRIRLQKKIQSDFAFARNLHSIKCNRLVPYVTYGKCIFTLRKLQLIVSLCIYNRALIALGNNNGCPNQRFIG